MIYGYIRVSTDKQTVENQRFEINDFCDRNSTVVNKWIEETISGARSVEERKLGRLLKRMKKGDVLICSELSRLGRNLLMIMGVLNECMNRDIRVWTIKDNYRLGSDINSKVLAFAFGLSAEIERNLISQRTKEALARKRAEGVTSLVSLHNELQKFQNRYDLLKIGLFDLWVANTDRSINNYNLLINSNRGYYEITPIDHSDIFDGCRLGQDLAQLTEYDSILSSDLAKTLLYNNKKIAEETRLLLKNFPNFVTACNNALPEIVAGIPNDWCSDKGTLHEQIKSSIIDNATWIADTKANFKELVAEYIIKR